MSECAVEGCYGPVKTRGWCRKHYERWWRRGSTDPHPAPTVPSALLAHIEAVLAARNVGGKVPLDICNRILDDMHDLNCRQTTWSCWTYQRYGLHVACHHCHPRRSAA